MSEQAKYKVLLASPWTNAGSGLSGTTWTTVGRAFVSRDGHGMNVYIHEGLSVTGMLVIKLDDGSDDSYHGSAAEAKQAHARRKQKAEPSSHQPFTADPLDDDIPF